MSHRYEEWGVVLSKIRKQDNKILGANPPIIKVDLASRDFSVHLGPFMPFNSGGVTTHALTSSTVITSNTTITVEAPKKKS
jgi:hypothetical protein